MNMLSKESFLKLRANLINYGGFSVKSFNDEGYDAFKINIGYLVSIKRYEEIIKLEDFTYERVKAYLSKEDLKNSFEPLIFGGWLNEEDNLIYLDMNKHIYNFSMAVRKGFIESQKAIYDLKNEKSIYLKDVSPMEFLSNE
jgi:hypothetical protein